MRARERVGTISRARAKAKAKARVRVRVKAEVVTARAKESYGSEQQVLLEVVIVRERVLDVNAEEHRRLIRPTPGHITQRVAAAAKDERRHVERLHELDTVRVACKNRKWRREQEKVEARRGEARPDGTRRDERY